MIISKFDGGLGNQIFQFSFAYLIGKKLNTTVLFDIDGYKKQELRDFELEHVFDLSIKRSPKIFNKIAKKKFLKIFKYFKEKEYYTYYSELFEHPKNNTYLEGFWQNKNYYAPYCEELIEVLKFKTNPSKQNQDLIEQMTMNNSISIHVRRGDYVQNKKTSEFHGECDLNYYKKAIEILSSKYDDPVFYIFSDDPMWVEENFDFLSDKTIISHNTGRESFEDMRLMSLCKHNIIANSSFSWWGAFLNTNKDKIVIAPAKWTNYHDTRSYEIVPKSWMVI